jgi:hypothetical protein
VLAGEPERLAAGHEDAQRGAGTQQVGHGAGGLDDLLEIVEDEQRSPGPQMVDQPLDRLTVTGVRRTQMLA